MLFVYNFANMVPSLTKPATDRVQPLADMSRLVLHTCVVIAQNPCTDDKSAQ